MIAVICPVHDNVEKVAAQIKNYAGIHGQNAIHFLHPSIEGGEDFSQIKAQYEIECEVVICQDQWPTNYQCTVGAAISATRELMEYSGDISHVYYHSDGDLLVHGGFVDTIVSRNNGYASRTIDPQKHKQKRELADPRFRAIREEMGLQDSDIRVGRIEGCFFEFGVWQEMLDLISKYYSKEFLEKATHWPLEAGIFPTLARKILDQEKSQTRQLIRTKYVKPEKVTDHVRHMEHSHIQIDDIIRERGHNKQNLCFGLKWFSPDLNHPARQFLTKTLDDTG